MFNASPKFLEKLEAQSKSASALPADQRAFLDAAWNGDLEKVRELSANGVPVDVREDFSLHYIQKEQTALMYAAAAGHLEIVRFLLKAGASVSAVDKNMSREDEGGQTALHYAVRQKNTAVVEELLSAGTDINTLTTRRNTPLNTALWHDSMDAARLLVQRGTNLSSKIGRKLAGSPLFATVDAIRNEVPAEIARDFALLLLDAGADPNGTGDANMTAIFPLASSEKIPEDIATTLLKKLLKAGAKPDWLDKFGSTPLQIAITRQKPKMVRLLLEAGADVNRPLQRGTALDINDKETAFFEKDLNESSASPPSADEKAAERQKQWRAHREDKLRRCKEISEILGVFGAKRQSDIPQHGF